EVTGVVVPVIGDMDAIVLLLFSPDDAASLCRMLGVEAETEVGVSALGEIANILGSSYICAVGQMTGLELEPRPPQTVSDMLGAILASVLAANVARSDIALFLDSQLVVEDAD